METLFDSFTIDAHHALVVFDTVTQDLGNVCFKEEASTDDIAAESTWEFFQLLLPWDVWIPHAVILPETLFYTEGQQQTGKRVIGFLSMPDKSGGDQ